MDEPLLRTLLGNPDVLISDQTMHVARPVSTLRILT